MSEQLRQGDPDITSDMDDSGANRDTLDRGYGHSEQSGEQQWSRERYEEGAREVAGKVLDNLPEGERGEVDRMAGGMFPPETTPGNETNTVTEAADTDETDAAKKQMPGAW